MSDTESASSSVTSIVLPDHVITYKHKHGLDLLAANGSLVLALVKRTFARSERLTAALTLLETQSALPDAPKIRGHLWLWRALRDVLALDAEAAGARKPFEVLEAPVELKPEWATELMTWMVVNDEASRARGVVPRINSIAQSAEIGPADLAPIRERAGSLQFLSAETLEQACEYRDLVRDRWKPEALQTPSRAQNILGRYLRFLNNLVGDAFDIETVAKDVPDYGFYVY